MSAEDLDNYETDAELALYKEYRDVIKLFTYVVETERRFYLANKVDFNVRSAGQDVYFDVQLTDAWVWDVYRSSRFAKSVRIVTFKDVNVEEVQKSDIDIPDGIGFGSMSGDERNVSDGSIPTDGSARFLYSRGGTSAGRMDTNPCRNREDLAIPHAGYRLYG